MQTEANQTVWRDIERQIKDLAIGKQIENLRSLLAEDWRSRQACHEVAEVDDRN